MVTQSSTPQTSQIEYLLTEVMTRPAALLRASLVRRSHNAVVGMITRKDLVRFQHHAKPQPAASQAASPARGSLQTSGGGLGC